MTRYFFNTGDFQLFRDEEGVNLASLSSARVHAIKYAGEVMSHEPAVLWNGRVFSVEVRNEDGSLLFIVTCTADNAPAGGNTK